MKEGHKPQHAYILMALEAILGCYLHSSLELEAYQSMSTAKTITTTRAQT